MLLRKDVWHAVADDGRAAIAIAITAATSIEKAGNQPDDCCVLQRLFIIVEIFSLIGLVLAVSVGRDYWALDLLTFFWTLVIAFAVLVLLISVFFPGPVVKIVAVVAVGISCVPIIRMPPGPDGAARHTFRLITANLFVENRDPREFVAFLIRQQPDIVVTQETTPAFQEAIRHSGLFPFESSGDLRARDDKKVFSRFPVREETPVAEPAGSVPLARHPLRLLLDTPSGPVVLYAVHPESPRSPERWRQRNLYLEALTQSVLLEPKALPVIVAGDWNTPPWSGYFRDFFERTGYRSVLGRPWPATTRFLMRLQNYVLFGAAIDHVALSPGLTMSQWKVGPKFGSNHLPVVVDIGLKQATALAQRRQPAGG